jgi:hypothetical protein
MPGTWVRPKLTIWPRFARTRWAGPAAILVRNIRVFYTLTRDGRDKPSHDEADENEPRN